MLSSSDQAPHTSLLCPPLGPWSPLHSASGWEGEDMYEIFTPFTSTPHLFDMRPTSLVTASWSPFTAFSSSH